jgi:hypothetical protein
MLCKSSHVSRIYAYFAGCDVERLEMFCHFKYLRGRWLSGTVPDGRAADVIGGVRQNWITLLLLTAGHAVGICGTFIANGDEESVSTRSQAAMGTSCFFRSVAELIGEYLHTVFGKGPSVNCIDERSCRQNVPSHSVITEVLTSGRFQKTCIGKHVNEVH